MGGCAAFLGFNWLSLGFGQNKSSEYTIMVSESCDEHLFIFLLLSNILQTKEFIDY